MLNSAKQSKLVSTWIYNAPNVNLYESNLVRGDSPVKSWVPKSKTVIIKMPNESYRSWRCSNWSKVDR